ncbi:hypothetical protein BCR35DRAFT_312990 [Leucosporidium creatinivorum]|uniref:Uncharacterized protein n=1 Tax=Leucosporidium creatinivorum TaxID=106004 RepID=A0A1Y2FW28_9BASI|nr:hypothetical protein BCR35DRAFT_312990 [Leucosporidium creatinivorum]
MSLYEQLWGALNLLSAEHGLPPAVRSELEAEGRNLRLEIERVSFLSGSAAVRPRQALKRWLEGFHNRVALVRTQRRAFSWMRRVSGNVADLRSLQMNRHRRTEVVNQYLDHARSLDALIDRHQGKLAPEILAEAHKVLNPSSESLEQLSTACIATHIGYRQKKGQDLLRILIAAERS